jgi:hypothetical protein
MSFTDTGYYLHQNLGEYGVQLALYKKGKQKWYRQFPYSKGQYPSSKLDRKGTALFWQFSYPYPYYTNSPFTLISSNGKTVLDQATLPGVGRSWKSSNFDKNRFYVSPPPSGNTHTIYGYKLGKKIKPLGTAVVNFLSHMEIHDGNVTVMQANTTPSYTFGFVQYDINLKKLRWMEPMTDAYVTHVDKNTFMRYKSVVNGTTTNLHVQIFNQKGVIAEHVIAR